MDKIGEQSGSACSTGDNGPIVASFQGPRDHMAKTDLTPPELTANLHGSTAG